MRLSSYAVVGMMLAFPLAMTAPVEEPAPVEGPAPVQGQTPAAEGQAPAGEGQAPVEEPPLSEPAKYYLDCLKKQKVSLVTSFPHMALSLDAHGFVFSSMTSVPCSVGARRPRSSPGSNMSYRKARHG